MNKSNILKRNTNLDIIRIVATITVFAVHFFLNTEYYAYPQSGISMFFITLLRSFFMLSVPLFLMLSGYLLCNKKLSIKYYGGLIRIIATYVIAIILIKLGANIILHQPLGFKSIISDILNFRQYSWYVELYVCLFLLVPFLNIITNNISKNGLLCLIGTLLFLTSVPTIINTLPIVSSYPLIPDYFSALWPLTYYFIGSFLNKYKDEFKPKGYIVALCYFVFLILLTAITFLQARGGAFRYGGWSNWESPFVIGCACCCFILLTKLKTDNYPLFIKRCLAFISNRTFSMYLVSWLFDAIIYTHLKAVAPNFFSQLPYILLTVPLVFLLSFVLSCIVDLIFQLLHKLITQLFLKKEDK